jgi:hypothetical protein
MAQLIRDINNPDTEIGAKNWEYVAREVESMTGDMTKQTKADAILGNTILFHRWIAHMVKLTLWTMPIHHPYAAYFVQQIANQGQEYNRDHGIVAPWLRDSVVIGAFMRPVLGDQPQSGWLTYSTNASNIWSTASGVAPMDMSGNVTPGAALGAVAGAIQPQFDAVFMGAFGNSTTRRAAASPSTASSTSRRAATS